MQSSPSTEFEYKEDGVWYLFRDNTEIYGKFWKVPDSKRIVASCTFIHGLGEHIHRYEHVFSKFADAGIQVFAWDQRGFGRTGKKHDKLGNNEGWNTVMDDVTEALKRNKVDGAPQFLYGHSMGGLIALWYLKYHSKDSNLAGVISTSPAIQAAPKARPDPVTFHVGRLLGKVVPSITITNAVPADTLSHDPKIIKHYKTDIYIHPYVTLGLGRDLMLNGKEFDKRGHEEFPEDIPLLLAHGDCDVVTDPISTKSFFEKCPVKDKTLKLWKGYFHELHNEPDIKDEFVQELIDWMVARSK
ncbi:Alpha/Beta hydrolase protein [Paraphysoderma sedebokerense]|nr:Alpha/Beta hydrolase protein [Paraphysoderma sedebokerense]